MAEAAGVCVAAVGGVLIRLHADASSASPSILVNKIDFFISVCVNRRWVNLPVTEPSKAPCEHLESLGKLAYSLDHRNYIEPAPCEHLIFSNIILMAND